MGARISDEKKWTEHGSRMGRWILAGTSKPYGKEETDVDTGRERQKKKHGRNFIPLLVGIDMPLPSPLEGGSWLLFFNSFVYSLFIEKEVQTPTSGFI